MRIVRKLIVDCLPSRLWGGEGVEESREIDGFRYRPTSQYSSTPHPNPPPQGGRESHPLRLIIALFAASFAAPALAFPHSFDGDWQVEARTTVGNCAPEASGTVRIEGGRVVASSAAGVEVWGYLDDNGAISTRFTAGQKMARGNGKLKGLTGSGAWSSNTDYCGGTWTAQKAK